MGNVIYNMVTREEMIKVIKEWYTFQVNMGKIQWNYYKLFIKLIECYSLPTLYSFYWISKKGLEDKSSGKL